MVKDASRLSVREADRYLTRTYLMKVHRSGCSGVRKNGSILI